MIVLGFIAEWLLFTFSLHQAVIELKEQEVALKEIQTTSKKYPDVSPIYWLFPPLKVWLEKKRVERILHDIAINRKNFDELFSLSNRAIAWAYIAVAEVFIGLISTDELLDLLNFQVSRGGFILINLLIIGISILFVIYRTSDLIRSRIYKRYSEIDED